MGKLVGQINSGSTKRLQQKYFVPCILFLIFIPFSGPATKRWSLRKKNFFEALKKLPQKNVATKLEGGELGLSGRATKNKTYFFAASLMHKFKSNNSQFYIFGLQVSGHSI